MVLKGYKPTTNQSKILHKEDELYKFNTIKPDFLHRYLRHADINQYLEYVSNRYSSFVTLHTIGMSYEQRAIMAIEIDCCSLIHPVQGHVRNRQHYTNRIKLSLLATDVGNQSSNKPETESDDLRNVVFIEGGTDAREWLTISVALNCIQELTAENLNHRDILGMLRFFIVPITNPDGYEYAHSKNCHWRKNRRPIENTRDIGVDCSRNYDFNWECGQTNAYRSTYKGEAPFSENETQAMRNALQSLAPNLLFFLSLHSHDQSIMYPWISDRRGLPNAWPHMQTIALAGQGAIRKLSGRQYICGSIAELKNCLISGSIIDYVFAIIRVPLALVMELPSADFGFQPPTYMIKSLVNETWVGIRGMCKSAMKLAPLVISDSSVCEEN